MSDHLQDPRAMHDAHARAQELFAKSLVEGLAKGEQTWLNAHREECAACSSEFSSTQEILQGLRTVHIATPRDLAARAQLRVRLRAAEAGQSSRSGFLIWAVTILSWVLGVVSAPMVWRGFAWAGAHFGFPKPALEMVFLLWWAIPALFAVGAVLYQRSLASGAGQAEDF
jgi:hypothetical protein